MRFKHTGVAVVLAGLLLPGAALAQPDSGAQPATPPKVVATVNGYEITAYTLAEKQDPSRSCGRWLILVDPAGRRTAYSSAAGGCGSCRSAWRNRLQPSSCSASSAAVTKRSSGDG